jgi:hypothetical protein
MIQKWPLHSVGVMLVVLLFIGFSEKSQSTTSEVTVAATLDLSLAALYSGKRYNNSKGLAASFKALSILTGELRAENYDTGNTTTIAWSAILDDETLTLTSSKTIALEPGNYTIELLLADNNYQYVGKTAFTIVDGEEHAIPLTVTPVIGNTIADVSVTTRIGVIRSYTQ